MKPGHESYLYSKQFDMSRLCLEYPTLYLSEGDRMGSVTISYWEVQGGGITSILWITYQLNRTEAFGPHQWSTDIFECSLIREADEGEMAKLIGIIANN